VQQFVQQAQRQGMRHVLIITGKGRIGEGVLRAHVPHWLNEPPLRALLSGLAYPPANRGGDGVLHVLVKRA
jgi:DNA-nicking Smr family endonuclease